MGPHDGDGERWEVIGMFNDQVTGTLSIENASPFILGESNLVYCVRLAFKNGVFEGYVSLLDLFRATIELELAKLFSKDLPKATLIVTPTEEERYEIILPFVKMEGNFLVFQGKSSLLGDITLELNIQSQDF